MQLSDAARVRNLSEQLGYPLAEEILRARIERVTTLPGHLALVAVEDQLVGWIHCFVCDLIEYPTTYVEIGGLVVDENYRGQGIGAQLVAAAEAWTKELGLGDIKVRSASHREGAHRFYTNLGFTLQKTQMRFVKPL